MDIDTQVLVVGGSLNGLTTAVCLARHGVACAVVERHPATTVQYKFRGISPRSMEIFRSLGIEAAVRRRDTGGQTHDIARARNLADPDVQWSGLAWPDASAYSPVQAATVDQDRLEPVLRDHAAALGAEIRFNTELIDFTEDADAVKARVRNRATGEIDRVTARYLIAADGANGAIRETLGIGRRGAGVLQHWMNLIFATDLQPYIHGRRFTSCFVTDVNGSILPRDADGDWLLAVQYSPERGERPEEFDADRCRELVRRAAGRADVKADLIDARAWEVAAFVAERFSRGRIFIVGDAAHVMPPTGGFGGNTGIQDAHNLAWKLALVLNKGVSSALLESYDQERRPIAEATLDQALARLSAWFRDPAKHLPPPVPIIDDYDVVFGQAYAEGAFVSDAAAPAPFEDHRRPSAGPGSRAPHVAIRRGGERLSTLDLFGPDFTILTGADGDAWRRAAAAVTETCGVAIATHQIGKDLQDEDGRWPGRYRLPSSGAVLVRPDGVVGWRAEDPGSDPESMLEAAMETILGGPPPSPR